MDADKLRKFLGEASDNVMLVLVRIGEGLSYLDLISVG